MTKPTMTSQWDPGNFKPLDMSKIPGYPRQMPPKYEKWLPRFTGSDGERADYHMVDFWSFFQFHPIGDDVEDLVMKLFSATLHGNARKWYDNLPVASITSMDQLEVTFLKNWGMKLKDIQTLLKRLEYIRQNENETVKDFEGRFQRLLYQIPATYTPEEKYLVYLYTNALLVHLGFVLNKKGPKTLHEAYDMAMQIEANISLSKGKHIFSLGTKINDPRDTSDTLSLERLVSLGTFTANFQEEGEQVIDQRNAKGKDLDEVFQPHREEQRIAENTVEEPETEQDDEVSTCPPLSDKAIHEPFPPAQKEENEVSHFPFQDLDNALFYDSEKEEEMESSNEVDLPCCTIKDEGETHEDETMMHVEDTQVLKAPAQEETNTVSYPPLQNFDDSLLYDLGNEEEIDEPLNVSNPACYDTDSDMVNNIDEFIHVGRRKWDVVGYDMDPIYDIENHFQVLPSQLSRQVTL
jgi:hypothetical protein